MCRLTSNNNPEASDAVAGVAGLEQSQAAPLTADYLVVGAGTAGMSFIDTLLTLDATATVILVDRTSQAGGHWTTAYPFVRLHQPACNYGVNSLPLGKARDGKGREKFDIDDRATGKDIVEYYGRVLDQFLDSGRVQVFFNSEYSEGAGKHMITTLSNGEVYNVTCSSVVKINTNLLVPSMRGEPPFSVDPQINFAPVNDLPRRIQSGQYNKYVIIGAGKTGCDSITYLLRNGVDQSTITWIISRDVWYFMRDGYIRPGHTYWQDVSRLIKPLVGKKASKSLKEAFLAYEKDGIVARLDPENRPYPEVFKGATIDKPELEGLRSVNNVVRMGRVTSISDDSVVLQEGTISISPSDTLIVDCMADLDGSFYGYTFPNDFHIFEPGKINLGPLVAVFNPSFSSAIIAYIETTFENDDRMKNSLLYFPRAEHAAPTPINFFSMFFSQLKTVEALGKHPPANKFLLKSRTNGDAPLHHGGFLPFIWGMFGPLQIAKSGSAFAKKVESGDFNDVKDCFGQPIREANVLKVKKNRKSKKDANEACEAVGGKKASAEASPPYPPRRAKKKSGFTCCKSVNAVHQ